MFFDLSEADEPGVIRWDGGGDGTTWEDPLNWNKGIVPGPGDHVIIDMPGLITVTHSLSETVIKSLYSAESFRFSGGSFVITSSLVISENLIVASDLIISNSLTISRALIVENGKLDLRLGRGLTVPTLTLSGGELSNNQTLTVTGGLTWSGGLLSGSGQTIVQGSTTLTGATYLKSISAQRLSLGNTVWEASANTGNGPYLYGGNGAVITLRTGAIFDLQGDYSFYHDGIGAVPVFNNQGTFTKSAGDVNTPSYVYFLFNNTGTLNANAGKLQLAGGGVSSGTFKTVAGATLDFAGGEQHLKSGTTVSGAGTTAFSGGTTIISGTVSGGVLVSGGTARFATTNTFSTLEVSNGELSNNQTLTVTGGLTWSGGLLSGSGQTIIQGTTNLAGNSYLKSISGQRLSLGNTIWEASANTGNGPYLYGGSGAVITLRTGATFDMQGDYTLYHDGIGAVSVWSSTHLHQVGW
ncbi:MAG: hypothetical protein U0175_32875 [Caldilineaceae bacterium]